MLKQTALLAGLVLLIGGYAATRAGFGDQLYHGTSVNAAIEQRQDPWWKGAQAEIAKEPAHANLAGLTSEPKILFRGNPDEKMVALTFDDGPHPGKVQQLLPILKSLDVKATFFVVGKMVEKHPELIKMEAAAGHEIADHSFSHVNLSKISEPEVETEYLACSDLIKHVLGYRPKFCRPPGGQATPDVMEAASRDHLVTAMWSDDPKDYSNPGTDLIAERLMKHVGNGAIILLHEGVDETMEILPAMVARLRSEGYQFVTMSELYKYDRTVPRSKAILTRITSVPANVRLTH